MVSKSLNTRVQVIRAERASCSVEMQQLPSKGETAPLNKAEDDLGVTRSLHGSKRETLLMLTADCVCCG